jgi:hypothetical protein
MLLTFASSSFFTIFFKYRFPTTTSEKKQVPQLERYDIDYFRVKYITTLQPYKEGLKKVLDGLDKKYRKWYDLILEIDLNPMEVIHYFIYPNESNSNSSGKLIDRLIKQISNKIKFVIVKFIVREGSLVKFCVRIFVVLSFSFLL